MNMKAKMMFFATVCAVSLGAFADCPEDHVLIGCNPDGIEGTTDDDRLFCDRGVLYRHSGEADYARWYYPMQASWLYGDYYAGEPGFEAMAGQDERHDDHDEAHELAGQNNLDFRLVLECLAIVEDPNFYVSRAGPAEAVITRAGDRLVVSDEPGLHLHVNYRGDGDGKLFWIRLRVVDEIGSYRPSEPFTIVFNRLATPGDIRVDGCVDLGDLEKLCRCWLWGFDPADDQALSRAREVDWFDRADINRDFRVDWRDFCLLAGHWLSTGPDEP